MFRHRLSALAGVLIVVVTLGLGGCNTVEGMGEDIEAAGEGIDKSAERNKSY